jgi:hypothetical protein
MPSITPLALQFRGWLWFESFQLLFIKNYKPARLDLIPFANFLGLDFFTTFRINHVLLDSVPFAIVKNVETDTLIFNS